MVGCDWCMKESQASSKIVEICCHLPLKPQQFSLYSSKRKEKKKYNSLYRAPDTNVPLSSM